MTSPRLSRRSVGCSRNPHRLPRVKPSALKDSAIALSDLLRVLKTFRGRHMNIAKKAYAEEVRLYDKGSGGAPVALLKEILDLTRANEKLLRPHGPNSRSTASL